MLTNVPRVDKFVGMVQNVSINLVLINVFAHMDMAGIRTTAYAPLLKNGAPTTTNVELMRNACNLENVFAHHRSTPILMTEIFVKVCIFQRISCIISQC